MRAELRVEDVPGVLARDAECLNHRSPQVQRLASARWRLVTGGTHEDWLRLRETDPDALVRDVQAALRRAALPGEETQE